MSHQRPILKGKLIKAQGYSTEDRIFTIIILHKCKVCWILSVNYHGQKRSVLDGSRWGPQTQDLHVWCGNRTGPPAATVAVLFVCVAWQQGRAACYCCCIICMCGVATGQGRLLLSLYYLHMWCGNRTGPPATVAVLFAYVVCQQDRAACCYCICIICMCYVATEQGRLLLLYLYYLHVWCGNRTGPPAAGTVAVLFRITMKRNASSLSEYLYTTVTVTTPSSHYSVFSAVSNWQ
jgi:hypothetical protein